jgi:cytoskeletal protein CcmA (bactofilin family)
MPRSSLTDCPIRVRFSSFRAIVATLAYRFAMTTRQGSPIAGPEPRGLELAAFVGPSAALLGKLSFSGNIRIDGIFEGELLGGDTVVLGPESRVKGRVSAQNVIILGGAIDADIFADRRVQIRPGAVVHGTLTSPEILVDPGAQFRGTFNTAPPPEVVEVEPRVVG